jgi:hypothetical protein
MTSCGKSFLNCWNFEKIVLATTVPLSSFRNRSVKPNGRVVVAKLLLQKVTLCTYVYRLKSPCIANVVWLAGRFVNVMQFESTVRWPAVGNRNSHRVLPNG